MGHWTGTQGCAFLINDPGIAEGGNENFSVLKLVLYCLQMWQATTSVWKREILVLRCKPALSFSCSVAKLCLQSGSAGPERSAAEVLSAAEETVPSNWLYGYCEITHKMILWARVWIDNTTLVYFSSHFWPEGGIVPCLLKQIILFIYLFIYGKTEANKYLTQVFLLCCAFLFWGGWRWSLLLWDDDWSLIHGLILPSAYSNFAVRLIRYCFIIPIEYW